MIQSKALVLIMGIYLQRKHRVGPRKCAMDMNALKKQAEVSCLKLVTCSLRINYCIFVAVSRCQGVIQSYFSNV